MDASVHGWWGLFWPIHRGLVVNVNAIALAHRKLNGQYELCGRCLQGS
jgi:hypothetical protein